MFPKIERWIMIIFVKILKNGNIWKSDSEYFCPNLKMDKKYLNDSDYFCPNSKNGQKYFQKFPKVSKSFQNGNGIVTIFVHFWNL